MRFQVYGIVIVQKGKPQSLAGVKGSGAMTVFATEGAAQRSLEDHGYESADEIKIVPLVVTDLPLEKVPRS
jgi:hypothetical protein